MNSCLGLIPTLISHVKGLEGLFAELGGKDLASAVTLRASLVKSLTALAEILDLMSRISPEPLTTDYRRHSIAALTRAVGVVHGLGHEDFTSIGTFLGVGCHELGQRLSLNNPELTLDVQISLKRLSNLLSSTTNRLYTTPIEGIDFHSLDPGASILAEAKERLRATLHPVPSSPDRFFEALLVVDVPR